MKRRQRIHDRPRRLATISRAGVLAGAATLAAVSLAAAPAAHAQRCCLLNEVLATSEARTYVDPRFPGVTTYYRLWKPPNPVAGRRYPLVTWLHSGSFQGTDNQRQVDSGMTYNLMFNPATQTRYPTFIIAPQIPTQGTAWASFESNPSWNPVVVRLIDTLIQELPIDDQRLYVTGLSLGGAGTWDIAARNPGKFAAIVPAAGVGLRSDASILMNSTAIWAFWNVHDTVVDPIGVRTNGIVGPRLMIERMIALGASVLATESTTGGARTLPSAAQRLVYTEYPNIGQDGHDPVRDGTQGGAYNEERLLLWLYAQRLPAKNPADGGAPVEVDAGVEADAAGGGGAGGEAGGGAGGSQEPPGTPADPPVTGGTSTSGGCAVASGAQVRSSPWTAAWTLPFLLMLALRHGRRRRELRGEDRDLSL